MTLGLPHEIAWRRWWCPAHLDQPVTGGFLDDPNGPYARYRQFPTIELATRDDVGCLVSLGEAGMGKSRELGRQEDRLREGGQRLLVVDLGAEPDVAALRSTVLSDPVVADWQAGSDDLVLLLDGFDEAMVTVDKLVDGLVRLLDALPVDRLTLRIVSRSSVWSARLDAALVDRWPDLERLVLCPLTSADVAAAAAGAGIDSVGFLQHVHKKDLGVLAARPLTLGMLLSLDDPAALPLDRTALYQQAVQVLARENNDRRLEEHPDDLPVEQRLRAARRLATVTLLSGRTMLHARRGSTTTTDNLALDDLATEATTLVELDQVTGSALFSPAGVGTSRWAHRSIAEFLAAQTLADLPVRTATYLLRDPIHDRAVVPQLAGVASWAAALSPDLYQWLADLQPELLLTANLASASDAQRRAVAASVLRSLGADTPPRDRRYFGLGYEGLGAAVAPFLADNQDNWVRREASRILADSGCHEQDARLVEIIEDIARRHPPDYLGEDVRLATALVFALDDCNDEQLLQRLVAIVATNEGPWQIRADLLGQLWRRVATTTLMSIVDGLGLVAGCSHFARAVAHGLATAALRGEVDLDVLLDWLDRSGLASVDQTGSPAAGCDDDWQQLVEAVALRLAVTGAEPARELVAARALVAWSRRGRDLFDFYADRVRELSDDARLRLAAKVLEHSPDAHTAYHLARAGALHDDDLQWWLRRYAATAPSSARADAAHAAIRQLSTPTAQQASLANALVSEVPALQPLVNDMFSPARVQSAADAAAEVAAKSATTAAATAAGEFGSTRLTAALVAADWPQVARELDSRVGTDQRVLGSAVDTAPAWRALDTQTRARMIELAHDNLAALPATADAGRADDAALPVELVGQYAPTQFAQLNPAVLIAWLDVIRARPAQDPAVHTLVAHLATAAPGDLETVLLQALAEDATAPFPTQIRKLGAFTTPRIEDALHDIATRLDTPPRTVEASLAALIQRAPQRGLSAAYRVIRRGPDRRPAGDLFRSRWRQAVHACSAVIKSSMCSVELDTILHVLDRSIDFASDVIATAEPDDRETQPWSGLDSDQLATLYLWARRSLPPEPDHPAGAVIAVNPVHEFASTVFRHLADHDDETAVSAINHVADELGEAWPRADATRIADRVRERRWEPLSPAEVVGILDDSTQRVVTSEAQLADVLLDAIDDEAHAIATDPNVAMLYWHRQVDTTPATWIPANETEFTTILTGRLQDRLDQVILRQEAQLHLRAGAIPGTEPDLEAVVNHAAVQVSVLGEAKGIWHDKVETAIEDQLAQRYVTGSRSSTGIYLVAAYTSNTWDARDENRRRHARRHDPHKLNELLRAAAERLSTGGKRIHVRVIEIAL